MLRQTLRSWGALLLEQQPVAVAKSTTAATTATARGMHVWTNAGRLGFAQVANKTPSSRLSAEKLRSAFSKQTVQRRAFHGSRTRWSDKTTSSAAEKAKQTAEKAKKTAGEAKEKALSLSARMKKLSREYGWAAVGVYLGLSLLDFPFCFLLVRTLGTEKIAAAEHYVVDHVKAIIPDSVKEYWRNYRANLKEVKKESGNAEGAEVANWGVEEADEALKGEASLATQLALAYAIHKSFIFVRVPLTAAVTPKVVKVLRSWGWKIGKQVVKKAT